MGSISESQASVSSRRRETGFPEPFCGNRNTTLPHPDADTSPDACICADTIKGQARPARSFLLKHKRTLSHGVITPEMERQISELSRLEGDEALVVVETRGSQDSTLSKDGASSPDRASLDRKSKRRSIFGRLKRH